MKNDLQRWTIVLALTAGLTWAQEPNSLRERIERFFLQRHPQDITQVLSYGASEEVEAVLLDMLRDYAEVEEPSKEQRFLFGAISVLGRMKSAKAYDPLYHLLEDTHRPSGVRSAAAYALGEIDVARCSDLLLKILDPANQNHPSLRLSAARSLENSSNPSVAKALEALAARESSGSVRREMGDAAKSIREKN